MAYLLVDRVDGTQQKLTVDPMETLTFPVNQGDDVQVVDRVGKHVSGKAVADGSDLRLLLADQSEVRLEEFYKSTPDAAPITVALDLVDNSEWDNATEIKIEEVNRIETFQSDLEQITFSYETIDKAGRITTKTVTVEVNGSRNCPLLIEDD